MFLADAVHGPILAWTGFIRAILSYEAEPGVGCFALARTLRIAGIHGHNGTVSGILRIYSKRCIRQSACHTAQTDISGIRNRIAGSDQRIVHIPLLLYCRLFHSCVLLLDSSTAQNAGDGHRVCAKPTAYSKENRLKTSCAKEL